MLMLEPMAWQFPRVTALPTGVVVERLILRQRPSNCETTKHPAPMRPPARTQLEHSTAQFCMLLESSVKEMDEIAIHKYPYRESGDGTGNIRGRAPALVRASSSSVTLLSRMSTSIHTKKPNKTTLTGA